MSSNRYSEAFKENLNLVGLATVAAASLALLNPVPLLVGVVAEAAYLLTVPDSRWFASRLSNRERKALERRRLELKQRILPNLRESMQQRYWRLEETRNQIQSTALEEEAWFQDVLRKLDYLMEKFLLFAGKEAEYRAHLRSVLDQVRSASRDLSPRSPRDRRPAQEQRRREEDQSAPMEQEPPVHSTDPWVRNSIREVQDFYALELGQVQGMIRSEPNADTKAILEKRLDVLQRRREFVGKIATILTNIDHQLSLLEDTFGLINDQIRAQSPEQVIHDIDDVVFQTDSMTRALEELAPLEQMIARLGTQGPADSPPHLS